MKVPPRATRTRTPPRATYLIKELERAVRARIDEIVQPFRLTAVQYTALSVLSRHPGMSSAELARRSFVSPQASNEMVSVLVRRRLIRRRVDRAGGRALEIFLTTLGERTLSECDEQMDGLEAQLFGGLTRPDETRFREMLRTCRDAARRSADAGDGPEYLGHLSSRSPREGSSISTAFHRR
jgi:DNA-binding MarR family transcriptional regulator